jgi:hypothetical protein
MMALVIKEVSENARLLELFSKAAHPYFRALFELALVGIWKKHTGQLESSNRDHFSDFIVACGNGRISDDLARALDRFILERNAQKLGKSMLIRQLRLDLSTSARNNFLDSIQKITLSCLQTPYPPKGHWIYEEVTAYNCWKDWIIFGHQPDSRIPRKPLLCIDFSSLQLVVDEEKSCIIRDAADSSIIGVVIRNFCGHPGVLSWVDKVICDVVEKKKSIRVC